jgi:hypothetical protein
MEHREWRTLYSPFYSQRHHLLASLHRDDLNRITRRTPDQPAHHPQHHSPLRHISSPTIPPSSARLPSQSHLPRLLLLTQPLPPHHPLNCPPQRLNPLHQAPPLFQLRPHMINRLLQHDALAPALAFKSGHEFGQAVEAFTDGLAAFLLCGGRWGLACRLRDGMGIGDDKGWMMEWVNGEE